MKPEVSFSLFLVITNNDESSSVKQDKQGYKKTKANQEVLKKNINCEKDKNLKERCVLLYKIPYQDRESKNLI